MLEGVQPLEFPFPGLSPIQLRSKWLCHFHADSFAQALRRRDRCFATSGVGLSGPPHAGTVCQLLRMVALQRAGVSVQFVLGDLDAYNARSRSLQEVRDLAARYRIFLERLGLNSSNAIVRTQEERLDILRMAYLIARHVRDEDLHATEEDVSSLYRERGVYEGVTFPVKQAIMLMIADFVALLSECDAVLVMLGVDEHRYVRLAARIAHAHLGRDALSGIYTRMLSGLGGYPKMSKSLPGSAVYADMRVETIRDLLLADRDATDGPQRSACFQILCCLPDATDSEIAHAFKVMRDDLPAWERIRAHTAEQFAGICEKWPRD